MGPQPVDVGSPQEIWKRQGKMIPQEIWKRQER